MKKGSNPSFFVEKGLVCYTFVRPVPYNPEFDSCEVKETR